MKNILLSSLCAVVFFSSCSKDEDKAPQETSSFTIGTSTYENLPWIATSGPSITATDENATVSIAATFRDSLPTSKGSYNIARFPDSTDDVEITAMTGFGANETYYSTGNDAQVAVVSINNLVRKIVIPEIWVKNDNGDSLKLSGKIVDYMD